MEFNVNVKLDATATLMGVLTRLTEAVEKSGSPKAVGIGVTQEELQKHIVSIPKPVIVEGKTDKEVKEAIAEDLKQAVETARELDKDAVLTAEDTRKAMDDAIERMKDAPKKMVRQQFILLAGEIAGKDCKPSQLETQEQIRLFISRIGELEWNGTEVTTKAPF